MTEVIGWPFLDCNLSFRLVLNLLTIAVVLPCTVLVASRIREGVRRRAQLRLGTLFVIVTTLGCLFALWQFRPLLDPYGRDAAWRWDFAPGDYLELQRWGYAYYFKGLAFDPTASGRPLLVRLPLLLGLACSFYVALESAAVHLRQFSRIAQQQAAPQRVESGPALQEPSAVSREREFTK